MCEQLGPDLNLNPTLVEAESTANGLVREPQNRTTAKAGAAAAKHQIHILLVTLAAHSKKD